MMIGQQHGGLSTLANTGEQASPSLDLPPYIQEMLALPQSPQAAVPRPSFEAGGMVGEGGQPVRPVQTGAPPQPVGAGLNQSVKESMAQNPEVAGHMRNAIQAGIQAGEITPEEIHTLVQLAQTVSENPHLYPQLRQAAIKEGIATEQQIPPEYDEGMVAVVLAIGEGLASAPQTAQIGGGQAPLSSASMQPSIGSYEDGGALPQTSPNADGSIPIDAHKGEYVLPADVVNYKGKEFLDKLITKAREDMNGGKDAEQKTG